MTQDGPVSDEPGGADRRDDDDVDGVEEPVGPGDAAEYGDDEYDDEYDDERGGCFRWFAETAVIIVGALVLSAIVRAFLVQAFYVPSSSMEDTLLVSDRIVVSKITTAVSGVQRGEVVVFRDPGADLALTVTGTALGAGGAAESTADLGATASLSIDSSTADGFVAMLEGADPNASYTPSATAGTITMGSLQGGRLPFIVSGLAPGESSTLTVSVQDSSAWLPAPDAAPGGVRGALRTALTFVGLLPSDSGRDLVKRVIGVGGDHVACCDAQGRIEVNGVGLDEPYIKGRTDQVTFDVTVPDGMVFVMGDNRGDSRDSRFHLDVNSGGVPVDNVVGRAFVTVWPFNRFGTLPIPDTFGDPAIGQGAGS
jgi:signal peptidase I